MPISYKINVIESLRAAGYTPAKLRKEKLLSESTIQSLRHNEKISFDALSTICKLLGKQPGDIIKYED